MSKTTTIITKCDLKDCSQEKDVDEVKMTVLFTTEQTEGRGVRTYLSYEKFDICSGCLDKVLKGNMIWGYGAQGNNTYYFKDDK